MSIYIKVNGPEPLTAYKTRSGDNYELIKVKGSGKDKKIIMLWAENRPTGIEEGDQFRVTEIRSIKYASKKDNRDNWVDEFYISCCVEKVGAVPSGAKQKSAAPEWTPPPREPTLYDIPGPEDGEDDGLPF